MVKLDDEKDERDYDDEDDEVDNKEGPGEGMGTTDEVRRTTGELWGSGKRVGWFELVI